MQEILLKKCFSKNTQQIIENLEREEYQNEKYDLLEYLNQGGQGVIYKAKNKVDGKIYAIKIQENNVQILNEIKINSLMEHPNILKIHDYNYQEGSKNICIVMDLIEGVDLEEYIQKRIQDDKQNQNKENLEIFQQIVETVIYYQSRNIIHRDLKPQNIMVEYKNSEKQDNQSEQQKLIKIKIIDWGNAKIHNFETQGKLSDQCGTPLYMAPEVYKKNYDLQSEVWSLGLIFYFIFQKGHPLDGVIDKKIKSQQLKIGQVSLSAKFWKDFDPKLFQLVNQMLIVNPKNRITIQQIQQFLNEYLQQSSSNIKALEQE